MKNYFFIMVLFVFLFFAVNAFADKPIWQQKDLCFDAVHCLEFEQGVFGPGHNGNVYLTWEEEGESFTKFYRTPLGTYSSQKPYTKINFPELEMVGFVQGGELIIVIDYLTFK